jgi:hypothetical protein
MQQIRIAIARAIREQIDLSVFDVDGPWPDAEGQQTFPGITGKIDIRGLQEIVVMLLPGAISQGNGREPEGDGGPVAEKGDIQRPDTYFPRETIA